MIVYLPLVAFLPGMLLAYGSAGVRRQVGTLGMVLAVAWSLALVAQPGAAWWGVGPAATILVLRRPARQASSFENLTGRTVTIALLMLVALFLASRLPVGENPLPLSVVPWFLISVGAAWVVRPIDAGERLQGQALLVGGIAAFLLAAVSAGSVSALASGATAMVPLLGERARVPATWRPAITTLGLALAAGVAALAATRLTLIRPSAADLAFDFAGSALLAVALVLVAGVLLAPVGDEWATLVAVVALTATAPSLRWAAVAALIAVSTVMERVGERSAWLAMILLALVPLLQALAPAAISSRIQTVALALGLVLIFYAGRAGMLRILVLPTTVFLVLVSVESMTIGNLTRFQWIVAVASVVFIGRGLLLRVRGAESPIVIGDQLIIGLLLLALSARDALGLGALAFVLLLLDLVIVRIGDVAAASRSIAARLLTFARSNWPPALTFAGASLAVIAALQASLALGLLAALMLAGLQLTPLLDRHALAAAPERPQSRVQWVGPVLSIACGIVPALVLRMLRL